MTNQGAGGAYGKNQRVQCDLYQNKLDWTSEVDAVTHMIALVSDFTSSYYRWASLDQRPDYTPTKCTHLPEHSGDPGHVAMCKSFLYRHQCLNKAPGSAADSANRPAEGGQGRCAWTPYKYSNTAATGIDFDSATWNRMPGFDSVGLNPINHGGNPLMTTDPLNS